MDLIILKEYIGFFAAFCTTVAFLPQAFKVWKSNNTKDISLSMFIIFTIGVFSWLVYGVLIESIPIMISNFFTLIFSLFILFYIIKNR